MPTLNKSEVLPLTTHMAQKGGASAHKFNKAPGNQCFPGTGALTDLLINARTLGRDQYQWDLFFLKPALICPVNPRVGKHRTPEDTWLGKGMKNSELGKTSCLYTPLHHTQLLSEAKQQSQRQQKEHSLLPTWEKQQGDIAVHRISCLELLHGNTHTPTAATTLG